MRGRLRAARLAGLIGVSLAGIGSPLASSGPEPTRKEAAIVVREPPCAPPPVALGAFVESLRAELAGRGPACCEVATIDQPTAGAVEVTVAPRHCPPVDDWLAIAVEDRQRRSSVRRELSLSDVAVSARPRALALVVAELVRALARDGHESPDRSIASPVAPPVASPAPTAAPVSPATKAPIQARPQPPPPLSPRPPPVELAKAAVAPAEAPVALSVREVAADVEVRHYPSHDTTLEGGRASLLVASASVRWFGRAGVGMLFARRHVALGDVTIRSPSLSVSAGRRVVLGPVALEVCGRGEVGLALVDGQAAGAGVSTGSGSNVLLGLSAGLSAQAPVGRLFGAHLGIEAGTTSRGITAQVNGAPVASMQGFHVLGTVGIELAVGRH